MTILFGGLLILLLAACFLQPKTSFHEEFVPVERPVEEPPDQCFIYYYTGKGEVEEGPFESLGDTYFLAVDGLATKRYSGYRIVRNGETIYSVNQ